MILLLAVMRASAADGWSDAEAWAVRDGLRVEGEAVLLGAALDAPWQRAARAEGLSAGRASWALPREGAFVWLRPTVGAASGALVPVLANGEGAAGALRGAFLPEVGARAGGLVAWLAPRGELSTAAPRAALDLPPTGFVGWDDGHLTAGVGRRGRALGPARFGGIARSEHAAPPPMAELAVAGGVGRGARFGQARVEVDVGTLERPRRDVTRPGLLQMDARWAPVGWLEVGATRMSIFGGEGRPAVDLRQLALPTEPHVYGDPERRLPDQNELVALDVRVALPRGWRPEGLRHAEAWWQYGGEDMVLEDALGLTLPGLAGIANLGGAEVALGPWTVTLEGSRLMDDTFRWYVGHRVYHDGFTQDGQVLGVPGGPDSATFTGAVAWSQEDARLRLLGSRVRRVGVVDAVDGRVRTLATEEHTLRAALEGDILARGWLLGAGAELARATGAGFVPGARSTEARAWLSVTGSFVKRFPGEALRRGNSPSAP